MVTGMIDVIGDDEC